MTAASVSGVAPGTAVRFPTRLALTLGALCLVIVLGAIASYHNVTRLLSASNWVSHTLEVRAALAALTTAVVDAETAQRGYIITGERAYVDRFDSAVRQIERSQALVRSLTQDNQSQQQRLNGLEQYTSERVAWGRHVIRVYNERGANAALEAVATGRGLMLTDVVRTAIDAMQAEEDALLAKRNRDQASTLHTTIAAFVVFTVISVLLALLVLYVMRRDLRHRLAAQRRLLVHAKAIEASVNGVLITNAAAPDEPIEFVNPALERISGYSAAEIVGRNCRFLQKDDREQPAIAEMRLALREGRTCRVVLRNYRKDGSLFWNDVTIAPVFGDSGTVTHHVGIVHDITERVRYEEELERQANFDSLTELPNRNLLMDRLRVALVAAGQARRKVAVAVVDLDNFKFVNDSLGHAVGDRLIKEVARRLHWVMGPQDTLARYAGDEFVLVTSGYENEEALANVLSGILATAAQKIQIEDHELLLTCSIGVSVYPTDGMDADTLLRHADLAMYRAKEGGRNRFELFLPELTRRVEERLLLENGIRAGLERDEFVLHYQPQIALRSGAIIGAEALVRWAHPHMGLVPPGRFIPVAEDSGLILQLGEWVLREACRQCRRWHDQGHRLRIAVNLSAAQFRQKNFEALIDSALKESGLSPHALELEVTESLLMTGADEMLQVLDRLKARGIELAIDDFGTGYSSLNYLKRLPLDRLKIDQSFVRGLPADAHDAAITRATISLSTAMALSTIAEGIETAEQNAFLRDHGCAEGQGYFFSRPVPAPAFEKLLASSE